MCFYFLAKAFFCFPKKTPNRRKRFIRWIGKIILTAVDFYNSCAIQLWQQTRNPDPKINLDHPCLFLKLNILYLLFVFVISFCAATTQEELNIACMAFPFEMWQATKLVLSVTILIIGPSNWIQPAALSCYLHKSWVDRLGEGRERERENESLMIGAHKFTQFSTLPLRFSLSLSLSLTQEPSLSLPPSTRRVGLKNERDSVGCVFPPKFWSSRL